MAGTDIVYFYTDPNTGEAYYGVRDLHNAWTAAGRPPINSAGRLYAEQKRARLAYLNGTGSPADDPDQPSRYELAHVRHAALDIDATQERVRALSAAGLVRPFSYEPWHWRLQNIYNYPIVSSIPASAHASAVAFPTEKDEEDEDDMVQPFVKVTRDDQPLFAVVGRGGSVNGVPTSAAALKGVDKILEAFKSSAAATPTVTLSGEEWEAGALEAFGVEGTSAPKA